MEKILSIIAIIVAVLAVGAVGFMMLNQPEVPSASEIAALVVVPSSTETVVVKELDNATVEKINELYDEEFEDEIEDKAMNDTAKDLVMKEMNTKDFKKAIMALLNDNSIANQSVEEYQDIMEIYSISFEEITLGEDDAEVVVEFKVKFVNDGDAEDESEKAKLTAIFLVDELVFDDAFEDAEAELDSIEMVKVYD
jgi:hypothetical protein